jgi:hypothetical protein
MHEMRDAWAGAGAGAFNLLAERLDFGWRAIHKEKNVYEKMELQFTLPIRSGIGMFEPTMSSYGS